MSYSDKDETPKGDGPSKETNASEITPQPVQTSATGAQQSGRVHLTQSGPQIYGQSSGSEYEGEQGVIRREISGQKRDDDSLEIQNLNAGTAERGTDEKPSVEKGSLPQAPPVRKRDPAESSASGQTRGKQSAGKTHIPQGSKKSGKTGRMIEASRRALRSPLMVLVAVFQTIYLVGGVAAVFMQELSYGQIAKIITSMGIPSQLSGYMSMFQSIMSYLDTDGMIAALLIRLPDLLFCIGLWLVCIIARTARERMSGSGFFLMRCCVIINMVVSCVVLLACLVLAVTLVIASWSSGTNSLLILSIIVLIAAIIVTMIVIMYYFCYLATIRIMQVNSSRGEFYGKVSVFVGIVHIVMGLTGIVSILSGIVNAEITGIVIGVGQIAWMVLFAVWIFCYRRVMSPYEE